MNNLKYLSFLILFFAGFFVSAQLELDKDSEHELSYTVTEDTIYITIDVFNDLSIDLDSNGTLEDGDDYVFLMWDLNANNQIDLSPSLVDIYYTYDSTQEGNLCNGHLSSPLVKETCSGSSGGWARVELIPTTNNLTPHVVYTFAIPKIDIDFGGAGALCGRISAEVHTGGTPMVDAATFPSYSGTDTYFVDPYNSIQLYPEAVITLPNGEPAPDNDQISVCVGDTLRVYDDYPNWHWNGLSGKYYQIVLDDIEFDKYGFAIVDPNDESCIISDTVNVILLDNYFCIGAYIFPNIVTPNGDGINDVFELILGQELLNQDWTGAELRVYDRWGILLEGPKSLDENVPRWDLRKDNGNLIPVGTYYYTFKTPGENSQTINGFFTVIHEE